jgi:hypothetical protein
MQVEIIHAVELPWRRTKTDVEVGLHFFAKLLRGRPLPHFHLLQHQLAVLDVPLGPALIVQQLLAFEGELNLKLLLPLLLDFLQEALSFCCTFAFHHLFDLLVCVVDGFFVQLHVGEL